MKSRHRWLVPAVVVLMGGTLGCVVAGFAGRGPFSVIKVTETELQPVVAAKLVGYGADPLLISIGVRWTKDGWCVGQFTVHATETATEIHVSSVISREYHWGACAGVGTADSMAWADLRLISPLGIRAVVRDSDGTRLPVLFV